jgi:hypothetical protein
MFTNKKGSLEMGAAIFAGCIFITALIALLSTLNFIPLFGNYQYAPINKTFYHSMDIPNVECTKLEFQELSECNDGKSYLLATNVWSESRCVQGCENKAFQVIS